MINHIPHFEFILYVSNQKRSTEFYTQLFRNEPTLEVPGMTEFQISDNIKIGLMPNDGIAKIISPPLPHPANANGTPRCELYFQVHNVETELDHALNIGAQLIQTAKSMDWGDTVGYIADPDGHVIAFAQKSSALK